MSGKRAFRLALVWTVVAGGLAATAPAAPWDKLLTLRRVEADADKSYRLGEENGPWMIMACSFSGEHAEEQAHDLVLELRKRYKLEAYSYQKQFDLGDRVTGLGVDPYGDPRKMHYQRGSEFEEVAVLVGNYPAVDDPEAQETLKKLKHYRPRCLELDPSRPTARNLASWRLFWKQSDPEKQKKGPMGQAMITPNPLLPQTYFDNPGVDPLVLEANDGVKHCLLDCPGKYSVQVATFRGRTVLDQQEIAAIRAGEKQMKSQLAEATLKAHKLTEALRQKGYEAYEFHDRYASIVTVGSFDWVTQQGAEGRARLNPEIQKLIDRFGPKQTPFGGNSAGLAQQTIVGIPLDLKPIPVHVPKRPVTGAFARKPLPLF
jgi:hypothetical protein